MDKKYYTPQVEEFHVGFEYEIRDWWTAEGPMGLSSNPTPQEIEKAKSYIPNPDGFTKRILTKVMLWEQRTRTKEELDELQKTSEGCVGNVGADYRHEWERITTGIKDGNIRVKCLDKEDIESEGFKADGVDVEMNHTYRKEKIVISVYPYLCSRVEISNGKYYPNRITYFDGTIKNKSELKKILNQIQDTFHMQQPPIGIKPMWLHNEHRLREINNAINRYRDAECELPQEWYSEKKSLEEYIKGRKISDNI